MPTLEKLVADLEKLKNPKKALLLGRFFKTGKGEYGEGDVFWGIVVPDSRKIAQKYFQEITLGEVRSLLEQKVHEVRFAAMATLVLKYQKGELKEKERVAKFYLRNLKGINNWDLVDLSAPQILGDYLFDKDKAIIYRLASSKDLWERRIAVLTTFGFIKQNDFHDALRIAEILLHDKHDLIHKAVGWMLREIGKRNKKAEVIFLKKHAKQMPRTALRYAIEKFPEKERKAWLDRG